MVLITAVLGLIVGYGLSLILPRRYTAIAKIIVEDPRVPTDYVRPVVQRNIFERVATMREKLINHTRLQPIITRYRLTEELNKMIYVGPNVFEENGRAAAVGFNIYFKANDPKLAQQVCSDLTSMFLEENQRTREEAAKGTNIFLEKQIEEAKHTLDLLDEKLAEFKGKYLGRLPGEEQTNINVLMSLNSQLDAATGALDRMQQDKAYTESLLSQQVAAWQVLRKGGPQPLTLEEQLAKMQDELAVLEARYTPRHPDIVKLKSDIAQLQKKIDEADASDNSQEEVNKSGKRSSPVEPQAIRQLKHQVEVLERGIQLKTREQENLQKQLSVVQGRLQISPVVEEQYKKLMRDYQTQQNTYNDLLNKKTQSLIATDLEKSQAGEQLRLLEPVALPIKPSYPDPIKFSLSGTGIGLMIGCAIALMLELRDQTLRTEKDVEFYLQLPALAVLPNVEQNDGTRQRKYLWHRGKRMVAQPSQRLGA
jgi:polysaccharide chain length determinant protein (PEP-CTERM system associated)